MNRRAFIKGTFALGATVATAPTLSQAAQKRPGYRLQLDVISDGYDGTSCWFHPRAGVIPDAPPTVVLTMQRWLVGKSDVFLPLSSLSSSDLGQTWTKPIEHAQTLGRHSEPGGVVVGICDFTPKWHAPTKTLLGIGHTVRYLGDKLIAVRSRETAWSVYDPARKSWTPWQILEMPKEEKFWNAGAGSGQRVDLKNGEILLPFYFKDKTAKAYSTAVARCTFDGKNLRYLEHGTELTINIERGLYEPSLAFFQGSYFLTMRNDRAAYVSTSKDGLHFTAPRLWTWDDGSDLGSYNTQAHWVTHQDRLFLVYTRRNAQNDNVVRHRAPLFLAQVDVKRLVVLRETEQELVPNHGAQLGNFGVVDVNAHETWVTTSEGMGGKGAKESGANARVYAARLIWDQPNSAWNRH